MNDFTPAQRLKTLRQAKHLTQAQMAAHLGVSPNYYACVERGENAPGTQILAWLALAERGEPISPAPHRPNAIRAAVARVLRAQGYTRRDIAKALGVTMRQVSRDWKEGDGYVAN